MARVSPFLIRGLRFYLVLGFWLVYSTAALPRFQKSTGLPVLAFPHVYLTQLRDRDLSHTGLTVSLDTVEDVMVGEVDELEEDVG